MTAVASEFSKIAEKYDLALFACAEEMDLTEYGIVDLPASTWN
jgi:hypothetical protein